LESELPSHPWGGARSIWIRRVEQAQQQTPWGLGYHEAQRALLMRNTFGRWSTLGSTTSATVVRRRKWDF